jgi:tRNA pseudouridine38-40 synthase
VGTNYAGSQIQRVSDGDSPKTIQSEIEKAICTLIQSQDCDEIKKRPIKTVFSGRTDKGVHSKGQVVHFESDKTLVASKFIYSMNEILPKDISVSDLKEVSTSFHALRSAKKRHYQYVFWNKDHRDAFDDNLLLFKGALNIQRMQTALDYLIGEHDFSSFKSSGSINPNKICFIYNVECKKLEDKVVINIVGNRFLYNMVRAIVGTLLLIEKKDLEPEFIKEVLEAKDRSRAGKNVNPHGLTLIKVEY